MWRNLVTQSSMLRCAVMVDIAAGVVSTFASTSDKKTQGKFRLWEFLKGNFVVLGSILYFFGLKSQNLYLKSAASIFYAIQSAAILIDGIKEKDNWTKAAGIVSILSSAFMAFIKTKI